MNYVTHDGPTEQGLLCVNIQRKNMMRRGSDFEGSASSSSRREKPAEISISILENQSKPKLVLEKRFIQDHGLVQKDFLNLSATGDTMPSIKDQTRNLKICPSKNSTIRDTPLPEVRSPLMFRLSKYGRFKMSTKHGVGKRNENSEISNTVNEKTSVIKALCMSKRKSSQIS